MATVREAAYRWSTWRWRGVSKVGLVLSALLLVGALDGYGQAAAPPEYQVKAVFLFNFTQFVAWPPSAFPDGQAPLVLGVLGDDPFGGFLDEAVRGEVVNSHPMVVERYRQVEDIEACHILFISASEAGRLERIFALLKGRNILTVGDSARFARQGGMVQFVTERNKIRLHINVEAAEAAALMISSKLLRLAEIVTPETD